MINRLLNMVIPGRKTRQIVRRRLGIKAIRPSGNIILSRDGNKNYPWVPNSAYKSGDD